jgi:hypothetical protein
MAVGERATPAPEGGGSARLDLRAYPDMLEKSSPADVVHFTETVDAAHCGKTAVLQFLAQGR